jgi:hypothetical protein
LWFPIIYGIFFGLNLKNPSAMKKSLYLVNAIITIVIISLVAACSGKSIQTSVLQSKIDNSRKLPSFDFIIDEESLVRTYGPNTQIYYTEYDDATGIFPDEVIHYQRDVKMNDLETLLERYTNTIIYNPSGEKYGKIIWKAIYYDYKKFTPVYGGIAFFTFGLSNLIGVPYRGFKTTVEVKAEIYNLNNFLIGEYYGTGIYKYVHGLYGAKKDQRSLNIEAAKLAVKSINSQIFNDYDALKSGLLSQR